MTEMLHTSLSYMRLADALLCYLATAIDNAACNLLVISYYRIQTKASPQYTHTLYTARMLLEKLV